MVKNFIIARIFSLLLLLFQFLLLLIILIITIIVAFIIITMSVVNTLASEPRGASFEPSTLWRQCGRLCAHAAAPLLTWC